MSDEISFWEVSEFNVTEFDITTAIERAIPDRPLFIALYVIDPDLLIYGICKRIRENKIVIPGVNKDCLEDVIGPAVHKVFTKMFLSKRELGYFVNKLKEKILKFLSENENQKRINGELGGW